MANFNTNDIQQLASTVSPSLAISNYIFKNTDLKKLYDLLSASLGGSLTLADVLLEGNLTNETAIKSNNSNSRINVFDNLLYLAYENGMISGKLIADNISTRLEHTQELLFNAPKTIFNGGNVGVNNNNPQAKLQINALNPFSSDYLIKLNNYLNNDLFNVRNDGVAVFKSNFDGVGLGNPNYSYQSDASLLIGYDCPSATYIRFHKNSLYRGEIYNNDGYFGITSKKRVSLKTSDDNKSHIWFDDNGFVGIGNDYFESAAQLHIKGLDTTTTNYSLKINNSSNLDLFSVRNDGVIIAPNLPTSASGLPAGSIYNDSGTLKIV